MPAPWTTFDGEDRATIDAIVADARAALADAGIRGLGTRFPFGMHHDLMRTRLRPLAGGRTLRHDEVAELMNRWAREAGGARAYASQAVAGAVEWLAASSLETRKLIPVPLATGDTSRFREWALSTREAPTASADGRDEGPKVVDVDEGLSVPVGGDADDEWVDVRLP